jgi:hypothetical protein
MVMYSGREKRNSVATYRGFEAEEGWVRLGIADVPILAAQYRF